jgi:hypothetical protein
MIFKLDFNLEAWIKDVEIEAESEAIAIAKLKSMSIAEILSDENNGFVKSQEISDITSELVAFDADVEVTDIKLDLNSSDLSLSEIVESERLLNQKPLRLHLSNIVDASEIEETIKEELWCTHKVDVESLTYKVINYK